MSVTEFKRKSKKAYFLFGAITIFLPACLVCIAFSLKMNAFMKENRVLSKKLEAQISQKGYVLLQEIKAGEKIEDDMLTEVVLTSKKGISIQAFSKSAIVGKYAKSEFKKGMMLNPQCVYEPMEYSKDMRVKMFDFIDLSPSINSGDYVDIRITYPNGEDYIIANHKLVLSVVASEKEDGTNQRVHIGMKVSEEEILRLTSAYVDTQCYTGTKIYAISYLDEFQQPGTVNYPVNMDVFQLLGWNPNLTDYVPSETESANRNKLEANLKAYGVSGVKDQIQAVEPETGSLSQ